jgi:hypothetical protein
MFAVFAGLAAGLLHVFSGPDHLAAVAPLAATGDRGHWRTGLRWGIGHTAGVLVIAGLLLLVRERLPLAAISAYSERIVGVALILVGAWGLLRAKASHGHSHSRASFGMGVIHGLAGSSHLFGVLPALAFATQFESVLYLTGFGAGAIAGMTAFAGSLGLVASSVGPRDSRGFHGVLYACSAAALVVGGFWLVGQ